jgi:tetratricopeptide (TPR) repeat protein
MLHAAQPQAVSVTIRAKALLILAELIRVRNQLAQSQQLAEESLVLYRTVGNEQGEALALRSLAWNIFDQGQADEARRLFESCLRLCRACNDEIGAARAARRIAAPPIELLEEVQAIFRAHGHWVGLANILSEQCRTAMLQGEYSLARRRLNESLNLTRRSAALAGLLASEMHLSGRLTLREGDYAKARVELEESTRLLRMQAMIWISFGE